MKTAAKQWFTARVKEEDEEDGGTKDADGSPSFGRVTPQIQVVLDKNGMPDQKSLFGFELSFYLGRPAAPQELEGAIFGAPPSVMLGATKNKKTVRFGPKDPFAICSLTYGALAYSRRTVDAIRWHRPQGVFLFGGGEGQAN